MTCVLQAIQRGKIGRRKARSKRAVLESAAAEEEPEEEYEVQAVTNERVNEVCKCITLYDTLRHTVRHTTLFDALQHCSTQYVTV